jgi:hypothetical protein
MPESRHYPEKILCNKIVMLLLLWVKQYLQPVGGHSEIFSYNSVKATFIVRQTEKISCVPIS